MRNQKGGWGDYYTIKRDLGNQAIKIICETQLIPGLNKPTVKMHLGKQENMNIDW